MAEIKRIGSAPKMSGITQMDLSLSYFKAMLRRRIYDMVKVPLNFLFFAVLTGYAVYSKNYDIAILSGAFFALVIAGECVFGDLLKFGKVHQEAWRYVRHSNPFHFLKPLEREEETVIPQSEPVDTKRNAVYGQMRFDQIVRAAVQSSRLNTLVTEYKSKAVACILSENQYIGTRLAKACVKAAADESIPEESMVATVIEAYNQEPPAHTHQDADGSVEVIEQSEDFVGLIEQSEV